MTKKKKRKKIQLKKKTVLAPGAKNSYILHESTYTYLSETFYYCKKKKTIINQRLL